MLITESSRTSDGQAMKHERRRREGEKGWRVPTGTKSSLTVCGAQAKLADRESPLSHFRRSGHEARKVKARREERVTSPDRDEIIINRMWSASETCGQRAPLPHLRRSSHEARKVKARREERITSPDRDEIILNRMCSASETCGLRESSRTSVGYAMLHRRLSIKASLTGLEGQRLS